MKKNDIFSMALTMNFFFICFHVNSNPLDSCFIGKITVLTTKLENEIGYEFYSKLKKISAGFRNQVIDEYKLATDYKLQLLETSEYFINCDTLIRINTNSIGDTLSVYVQIKDNSYYKYGNQISFTKMNIVHSIQKVKKWNEISQKGKLYKNLKIYKGNQNLARYKLVIDPASNYILQSNLPYNFAEVFFQGSLIQEKSREYPSHGKYETEKTIDINLNPINYQEIMSNLSFSPNEYEKPLTVNRIFYSSDTVLLDTNLRPKAHIHFHTTDKDSFALEDMPGDYKFIAFVHGKSDKKKLKDDLKDLGLTYQNKNIRFYIVELNENNANDFGATLIEKKPDNTDSIYYFKPGIRHPLFAKLDSVVYPLFFLFDREGKIVLVEAPPPTDPNLCSVLDRLE